jgi:hypothetical protein
MNGVRSVPVAVGCGAYVRASVNRSLDVRMPGPQPLNYIHTDFVKGPRMTVYTSAHSRNHSLGLAPSGSIRYARSTAIPTLSGIEVGAVRGRAIANRGPARVSNGFLNSE